MKNNIIKVLLICTTYLCCVFNLQAKPLLTAYPDAKLENKVILEGEEAQFVSAFNPALKKSQQFEYKTFIGDVSHFSYQVKNVASLKVMENYKNALSDAGFKVLYTCALSDCYGRREDKLLAEESSYFNVSSYYGQPHYIYATKGDLPEAAISLFVGQYKNTTQALLTTVNIKEIETGLIKADFEAFKKKFSNKIKKSTHEDLKGSADHPLLSRYPGSYIEDYQNVDYEEFSIPIGKFDKKTKASPVLDVTGDLTRITYIANKVSTLKIYHNYVSALTKEGFESVFSCQKDECGTKRKEIQALGDKLAIKSVYNYFREPRYQVMKNTVNEQTTYVAFFIGNYNGDSRIQLLVARTEPLVTGLIETNSDKVLEQLEQKGKASIYGVLFDYDKATIKAESKEALDIIAEVMKKNKKLSLYVVGHTDDKGSPDYNLNLSKRRADAVVSALIADYGIAKARLLAQGAGPYSPVATNKNDLGRELNRRVELVERLSSSK
ncbi:OmpA family protein [Pseudoalteromonas distincta]|uniref:OmpA family protein n=1 Tax=Pseudoalteromonas distincta TaxID=77608 RepID=UPI003218BCA7